MTRRLFLGLVLPLGGCAIKFQASLSGSDEVEAAVVDVIRENLTEEDEEETVEVVAMSWRVPIEHKDGTFSFLEMGTD